MKNSVFETKYPRNPIGIFGALIVCSESPALIFYALSEKIGSTMTIVLFSYILTIPIIFSVLFCYILLYRREILYSPSDFQEDSSFLTLINTRLSKSEGRIRALSVDPSGASIDSISSIIADLAQNDDWDGSIGLIRGLIKSGRYQSCKEIMGMMIREYRVPDKTTDQINKFQGIASAMLGEYSKSLDLLSMEDNSVSALLALSFSKFKTNRLPEAKEALEKARSIDQSDSASRLINRYYPELVNV